VIIIVFYYDFLQFLAFIRQINFHYTCDKRNFIACLQFSLAYQFPLTFVRVYLVFFIPQEVII